MNIFSFFVSLFSRQGTEDSSSFSLQDEFEKAARSVNGMPDVGEVSDGLSEMDDKEFFDVQGDGLRDGSAGYGRESGGAGYSNPFDNQINQIKGSDPNANNGLGQ
jgi:hypothetical protein